MLETFEDTRLMQPIMTLMNRHSCTISLVAR